MLAVTHGVDPVHRGAVDIAKDPLEIPLVGARAAADADLAVRLGYALREVQWYPHQHGQSIARFEPASTPVHGPLDADTNAALARCQSIADSIANAPPPRPDARNLDWPRGPDGVSVKLRWAGTERPAEQSATRTELLDPDKRATIWRAIVTEIASSWARADAVGKSSGRVFLGPKNRFLFWPRALNSLLDHVPASMGRILDLFDCLAANGVKLDVKSAYRMLGLDEEDALYHAAVIDTVWIVFNRLSFGMAQSPIIFSSAIALTIDRFRASMPAVHSTMSSWVDDVALGGTSTAVTVRNAERLLEAFRTDQWWASIAKCWLWPCRRLAYIGFLVDFDDRSVRIDPAKAAKAMSFLRTVVRPTDAAIAAATPPAPAPNPASSEPLYRRDAVARAMRAPGAHTLAIGPLESSDVAGPVTVDYVHGPADPPLPSSFVTGNEYVYTSAAQARSLLGNVIATAHDAGRSIVLSAPSATAAAEICSHLVAPPVGIVVVVPAQSPVTPPASRPTAGAAADTDIATPAQSGGRLHLTPDEFHAVTKVLGYLAWFQVAIPFIAPWRALLAPLATTGQWSASTADAFDCVYRLLQICPHWSFPVDPPRNELLVVTDASATGWGATFSAPDGRLIRLAGALTTEQAIQSSTLREATAAVHAIQAAIDAGLRFDAVHVVVDSTSLCGSARGHVRSPAVAAVMTTFAAWASRGLRVRFTWQARDSPSHEGPDALSSATSLRRPWPLRRDALALLESEVGPFSVDLYSYGGQSTTLAPAYATPSGDTPDHRRIVLEGLPPGQNTRPESPRVGWVGLSTSIAARPDETFIALPLWSDIRAILPWWRQAGRPRLVVIAPALSPSTSDKWWGSPLSQLADAADFSRPMPLTSTVPPRPGIPVDPRPLRAYALGFPDLTSLHRGSGLGSPAETSWVRGGRNPGDGPIPSDSDSPDRRRRRRLADAFASRAPAPPAQGDPRPARLATRRASTTAPTPSPALPTAPAAILASPPAPSESSARPPPAAPATHRRRPVPHRAVPFRPPPSTPAAPATASLVGVPTADAALATNHAVPSLPAATAVPATARSLRAATAAGAVAAACGSARGPAAARPTATAPTASARRTAPPRAAARPHRSRVRHRRAGPRRPPPARRRAAGRSHRRSRVRHAGSGRWRRQRGSFRHHPRVPPQRRQRRHRRRTAPHLAAHRPRVVPRSARLCRRVVQRRHRPVRPCGPPCRRGSRARRDTSQGDSGQYATRARPELPPPSSGVARRRAGLTLPARDHRRSRDGVRPQAPAPPPTLQVGRLSHGLHATVRPQRRRGALPQSRHPLPPCLRHHRSVVPGRAGGERPAGAQPGLACAPR